MVRYSIDCIVQRETLQHTMSVRLRFGANPDVGLKFGPGFTRAFLFAKLIEAAALILAT
jgi:hypothetical protein